MNTKWPEFDVIRTMKPEDPQGVGEDGTGSGDDPDSGNQKPPNNS